MDYMPQEVKKGTSRTTKILLIILLVVFGSLLYINKDLIKHFIDPSTSASVSMTKEYADLYKKALAEYNKGDFVNAIRDCKQILAKYPDNPHTNDLIALTLYKKGDYKEALSYCDRSIKQVKSPAYFVRRAKINTALKNYRNTLSDYRQALKIDNNYDYAYLGRAEFKRDKMNDYKGAIADFKSYLKIHPNNGNVMRAIAKIQNENLGSPLESLQTLNELAQNNKECRTYIDRAGINYSIDRFDDALADADTAFEICGKDAYAYNSLGIQYKDLKAYDKASLSYAKAREIQPTLSAAYYNEARMYQFTLKDNNKALEWYNKTVEVDPKNYDAYMNRSIIYNDLGDHDKAIQDINTYLAKYPDYAPAIYNRGNYYSNKKDYISAIQDYSSAINYNPRFAWAHLAKGLSSIYISDFDTAVKEILEFLDIGEASGKISNYYTYFNQGYATASRTIRGTEAQFEEAFLILGPETDDQIKLFDRVVSRDRDNLFYLLITPSVKKSDGVPYQEYYKQVEEVNPQLAKAMQEVFKKMIFYQRTRQDWMPLGKDIKLLEETYPNFFYWYLAELELTKDLKRAKELSDIILKVNPYVASAPAMLGYKYYLAGQYDKAKQAIDQAIKINPYYSNAYLIDILIDIKTGNYGKVSAKAKKVEELRGIISELPSN